MVTFELLKIARCYRIVLVLHYAAMLVGWGCNVDVDNRLRKNSDILRSVTRTVQMAAKTKPLNQQKSRKCGLTSGPLRATQSFGLAPKKLVEPVRVQTSTVCSPHHQDAKDSRRSSSPDSPGVLRRGKAVFFSWNHARLYVRLKLRRQSITAGKLISFNASVWCLSDDVG